jgi:hypothetical protein
LTVLSDDERPFVIYGDNGERRDDATERPAAK